MAPNTQDMLKALNDDDVNGFKDQIEADLQDRIRQHIDLKKIEISQKSCNWGNRGKLRRKWVI